VVGVRAACVDVLCVSRALPFAMRRELVGTGDPLSGQTVAEGAHRVRLPGAERRASSTAAKNSSSQRRVVNRARPTVTVRSRTSEMPPDAQRWRAAL
jgi:hypothetical protein